ncbi:MAG: hypothetical protein MJ094_06585 [Saccharofermentans sp.]|nr:hypothetical protein [Saccharofermentans sp.]
MSEKVTYNSEQLIEHYKELRITCDDLLTMRHELEILKADVEFAWRGSASYEFSYAIDVINQKISAIESQLDNVGRLLLKKTEQM